jgi:hypothetical protein
VTAPVDADDTSCAYFEKTPFGYRDAGGDQFFSRCAISLSSSSTASVRS